ncbi:hypothetical protein EDL99_10895 [Ornithobacterium rhinotracheale]|uniref:HTH domain-containing protein n=1 Tax=Ornithobacterium rhinotracheale TaxID=28251 RepID=UPI00129C7610|nr:HTH domain-containing protein [Ornithobacterium rhinotracheale]MRJ09361.1 hypothetical protein [Ornithobacterium rhinotracheale]UOH78998.1 hypothetical protein MT996_11835 [Ornithobacterium rhinotracheale]
MDTKYTTSQMAEIIGVSVRTIQRQLATLRDSLSPNNKIFNNNVLQILELINRKDLSDTKRHQTTLNDNENEFDRVEYFTEEEYQEFHKRLVEYPLLLDKIKMLVQELEMSKRNEIWYQEQQERLLNTINQRNYIEAKEKNLD